MDGLSGDYTNEAKLKIKKALFLGCRALTSGVYTKWSDIEIISPKVLLQFSELVPTNCTVNENELIDFVKELAKDPLVSDFNLSMVICCFLKSKNRKLQACAYKTITDISKNTDFILEVLKNLTIYKRIDNCGLWGEGMRRALKNWYGNMSDKQFAELLAFRNRKYSWSHRDVLKLIHFKAPNPAFDVVFKYFLMEKEHLRNELSEGVEEIAKDHESLKSTEDVQVIARIMTKYKLGDTFIPKKFYKSTELWVELLRSEYWTVEEILERVEFLSHLKNFTELLEPVILGILNVPANWEKISPSQVFLAIRRYENHDYFTHREKVISKQKILTAPIIEPTPKTVKKLTAPKSSPKLLIALNVFLARVLDAYPKSTQDFLLVLDFPSGASTVLPSMKVLPNILVAEYLNKFAKAVGKSSQCLAKGVTDFSDFKKVKTEKSESLSELLRLTLTYAKAADTVLLITDNSKVQKECVERCSTAFNEYRKSKNKMNAKLILVLLRGGSITDPVNVDSNTLVLNNFGEDFDRIISYFSQGKL